MDSKKIFVVTHNGYEVEFFDTADEVEKYIADTLVPHKDLNPKEIFRHYGSNTEPGEVSKETIKTVIIYQYYTLYTEVFMIEEK